MANTSTLEILFIDKSLAMRPTLGGVVGQWEYHPICNFVSLTGHPHIGFATRDLATNQRRQRYKWDNMLKIMIETTAGEDQPIILFDLNQVTNQAGWTLDAAGVAQCIADINLWIAQCSDPSGAPGGGATEATLLLQRDGEFGNQVYDENDVIWDVRFLYNPTAGTWSIEYIDPFGSVGVPVGDTTWITQRSNAQMVNIENAIAAINSETSNWGETDNAAIVSAIFSKVGGRAVNTVGYVPAYTADDAANLAIDKDNGGLLVNQANLAEDEDEVTAFLKATDSAIGALSKFRSITVGDTGEVVKATTGNLYRLNVVNRDNNDVIFVKLYDKVAAPTAADTPVYTFSINSGVGSMNDKEFTTPMNFTNGLGVRCVTGVLDANADDATIDPIIEIEFK